MTRAAFIPALAWILLAVSLPPGGAGARAAELDAIRERGWLVWAADQEGGGPHVYPDPEEPTRHAPPGPASASCSTVSSAESRRATSWRA